MHFLHFEPRHAVKVIVFSDQLIYSVANRDEEYSTVTETVKHFPNLKVEGEFNLFGLILLPKRRRGADQGRARGKAHARCIN